MTDNEIIKGLERWVKIGAGGCKTAFNALNLIKCQKAEIDRLEEQIGSLNKAYPCTVDVGNNCLVYARSLDDYDNLIGDISAEGIKEFADRLEYFVLNEDPEINDLKCKDYESYMGGANQFRLQIVKGINNLVKELTPTDTSVSLIDGHIEAESTDNDVKCVECEYLMFSDMYGECSKNYKGIAHPDDSCGKGKRKVVCRNEQKI